MLDSFVDDWRKSRTHLSKTAREHTFVVAKAEFKKFVDELLLNPPYSPNLVFCNHCLFPIFKKWPSGKRFCSFGEIIDQTSDYIKDFDQFYYLEDVIILAKCWTKSMELKGHCVEILNFFWWNICVSSQKNIYFYFTSSVFYPIELFKRWKTVQRLSTYIMVIILDIISFLQFFISAYSFEWSNS